MGIFFKKYRVNPNNQGFLFHKNKLKEKLESGIYYFFDPFSFYSVFSLPKTNLFIYAPGQEVISKDNISLRFSYSVVYSINDSEKFISQFELNQPYVLAKAEELIRNLTQVYLRERISEIDSQEINEKRTEIFQASKDKVNEEFSFYGISISSILLKDIYFPKSIQELFARQLEAKIRAKADLENARTQVATARALKNAAELLKENPELKFLYYLETLNKVCTKGKHTFVLGNILKDGQNS